MRSCSLVLYITNYMVVSKCEHLENKQSLLLCRYYYTPLKSHPGWGGVTIIEGDVIGPPLWYTCCCCLPCFQRTTLKAATAPLRQHLLSHVFGRTKILFINVFGAATMTTPSGFSLYVPLFAVCLAFGAISTANGKLLLCLHVLSWRGV